MAFGSQIVFFRDMLDALRSDLSRKICNGEMTERGLARRIGISQAHMNNVLKGVRTLTPEIADRILRELGLQAEDLRPAEAPRKSPGTEAGPAAPAQSPEQKAS